MGKLQGLSLLISVWFLALLIVASIALVTIAKRKFTKILGVVVIIGSMLLVVFEFMQFSAYLEMCSSDRRYEYSEVKHLGGFIERTFFVEMNENTQDIELVETYRYSPTLEHCTIVLEANVQNLELFLTENINIPTRISACTCPCEACMDCEQQSIDVLEPEISEYPIYETGNYSFVYVIETNLMQRSFTDMLPSEKAAVQLSYAPEEIQKTVCTLGKTINKEMAVKLRKEGVAILDVIDIVCRTQKKLVATVKSVKISEDLYEKYFKGADTKAVENVVAKALAAWFEEKEA